MSNTAGNNPLLRAAGWIFDPPKETLRLRLTGVLSTAQLIGLLASTVLSVSLAETIAIAGSGRLWAQSAATFGAAIFLWLILYYGISKQAMARTAPFGDWFAAAVLAGLPLHLLLPAALLLRGHGVPSLTIYELVKYLVLLSVAKRIVLAIETLNGWPPWKAFFLLLAPFVFGAVGAVLIGALVLAGFFVLLSGALVL